VLYICWCGLVNDTSGLVATSQNLIEAILKFPRGRTANSCKFTEE